MKKCFVFFKVWPQLCQKQNDGLDLLDWTNVLFENDFGQSAHYQMNWNENFLTNDGEVQAGESAGTW